VPPVNGKNVVLTVDQQIQLYAEQAAQQALTDNKAKSVTITVMNPKNGEILAMASKPDFNPNNPSQNISGTSTPVDELWQNNAVQQSFEPGSIFKVITSYTGLITGVANQIASYTCNGSINVDGTVIHCWDLAGHGTENFQQIIKNSCNVGFVELGMHIGKDNLMKYIKLFGLGQKTGIDLPGEASGIVRDVKNINNVDLAEISFGQGISVTAVQYLAAFNSVANGGTWIRPHVMKQIDHDTSKGKTIVDQKYNNYGEKKILDTNIASELRGYLLHVVSDSDGVGYAANVPGLDIAGKTGTAQIADAKTGAYAPGKYMSSFAGMAPVSDPKITLLVSVNQPGTGNYYASQVAAPVAKQLFTEIFQYLNVTNYAALK
jgi:stage V sporulation protein D (sporulation-specific penicillin-binding protein)